MRQEENKHKSKIELLLWASIIQYSDELKSDSYIIMSSICEFYIRILQEFQIIT